MYYCEPGCCVVCVRIRKSEDSCQLYVWLMNESIMDEYGDGVGVGVWSVYDGRAFFFAVN